MRFGVLSDSFILGPIGLYQILFQISINEPGQLQINLNGSAVSNSVVGRATGTSQLVGINILQTTTINSILKIQNPIGNTTALTITPLAGGNLSVSAHLIIIQLA